MSPFAVGTFGLVGAAVLSGVGIIAGVAGWRLNDGRLKEIARRAPVALAAMLTLSTVTLIIAFLTDSFELSYVAYNSSRAMPLFYKFSAFWGSLDGSMLLWAWMLAMYAALAMIRHRDSDPELLPITSAVLSAILLFFSLVILVTTNPFDLLTGPDGVPFVPPDGLGLNPLLQNPGMVIHPPTLYHGFTGFTVPFAFAIAALVTGRLGADWVRNTRRWTLIAWGFLTAGNLFGANWAYVELGWGGYWGWDPVENSSLMPWFTGTAFLHSVIIQEKKGMLKIWNVSLVMLTFWLTIYGTFLTRSGVVSSVHAFANGTVGPLFLGFLVVSVVLGLALLIWRWDDLKSERRLQSAFSREGAFVVNNVVLIGLLFATFWGTSFPVLNEALTGQKITIGPPFFNRVNAPLALALLALLAVGPMLAWGRATAANVRRNLLAPALFGVAAGGIVWALGIREPWPVFVYVLGVFSLMTIVLEFSRGVAARRRNLGESAPLALLRLVSRNRRRYGGYVVHLGVLLLFLGITGNFFARETEVRLAPGDETEFAGRALRLEAIEHRARRNYDSQMALITRTDGRGQELVMWPEKRQYRDSRGEVSTEVAIDGGWFSDLYIIFLDEVPETGQAVLRLHLNPLVRWIWLGGGLMMVGILIGISPERRRRTV
jgi:cytochrome c-type biogenesis protein CcmF